MSALFNLALVGAGIWAFKEGHFGRLGYQLQGLGFASPETAVGNLGGVFTNGLEGISEYLGFDDVEDAPTVQIPAPVAETPVTVTPTPAAYVPPVIVAPKPSGGLTKEEEWLAQYNHYTLPWARSNKTWVAAMMWQESRGNPKATSHAGARGLMQVVDGTMEWMYNRGYREFPADPKTLYRPEVSIYFGTAFLQYLSTLSSNRDWITRAYNAGPGGQRKDGSWPAETVDYLAKIKQRHNLLKGA